MDDHLDALIARTVAVLHASNAILASTLESRESLRQLHATEHSLSKRSQQFELDLEASAQEQDRQLDELAAQLEHHLAPAHSPAYQLLAKLAHPPPAPSKPISIHSSSDTLAHTPELSIASSSHSSHFHSPPIPIPRYYDNHGNPFPLLRHQKAHSRLSIAALEFEKAPPDKPKRRASAPYTFRSLPPQSRPVLTTAKSTSSAASPTSNLSQAQQSLLSLTKQ